MNDLVKRLRASVNLGAVRGNSFERGVCESQMSEAASVITAMQEEIAALRESLGLLQIGHDHKATLLASCEIALGERDERIAALEKAIANAPHTHDCDAYIWIDGVCNCWKLEALREAGYLKEEG